jgi:hypothetical protein
MTSSQCVAARKLLGWSCYKLAAKSGAPAHAVRKFERFGIVSAITSVMPRIDRMAAIRAAFETAGVEFIDGGQPAVRLGLSLKQER